MTELLTRTEAVGRLIELAREMEIKTFDVVPSEINIDHAYEMCANNVLTQLYAVPEDHKETVSLATITKLLVENMMLHIKLNEVKNVSNSNSD
jgi:short subunit dehydrogenase-like uncharacterized protein